MMKVMRKSYRIYINMFIFATVVVSISMVGGTNPEIPKCVCSEDISDSVKDLRKEFDLHIAEFSKWNKIYDFMLGLPDRINNVENSATDFDKRINELKAQVDHNDHTLGNLVEHYPFVKDFKVMWENNYLETVVKDLLGKYGITPPLPKAESLTMKSEDEMLRDSPMIPKPPEEDGELAKDVSNLLAKVEKVENKTLEVEEELKSERRVRRHLEEEMKETHATLISLEDQLHNVSIPVDVVMSHVQMAIFSSLEDMNRTIYEDHLQKLYYKVDGVVYKNETRKLDERIEHVEAEINEGFNSSFAVKLIEELKNLEENLEIINKSIGDDLVPRMMVLESETVRKDVAEALEDKMIDLLNNTENFKTELSNVWADIQDFQSFQRKLENFSMEWTKSLEELQTQIKVFKNKTSDSSSYVSQIVEDPYDMDEVVMIDPKNETKIDDEEFTLRTTEDDFTSPTLNGTSGGEEEETTTWGNYIVSPTVPNRLRIGGSSATYIDTCDVPVTDDPHLLIDIKTETNGTQKLIFGCRPIGQYIVDNPPIPVRCEGGFWNGPLPTCVPLLESNSIEILSEKIAEENPCTTHSGEYPDPTNCTRFFKCDHQRGTLITCPAGLHFNKNLKICDYPTIAGCEEVKSELIQALQNLIPPILIDPNIVDKPSGLLGTGPVGQLIVHPRSSFTLHCLYPENVWGYPVWNVPESVTMARNLIRQKGKNKVSLTITAAKEEDSGLYKCITPYGKAHRIHVSVKAVKCPPIPLDEEYDEVFYRPTPEGETRILGTRADFPCMEETISAICMANGKWSRGPPDETECEMRKRCKPLDIADNEGLILEEDFNMKRVNFKCSNGLSLVGNSYVRCLDNGEWSHSSFPKCV